MSDYLRANKWEQRPDGKWTQSPLKNAYTQENAEKMQETIDELIGGSVDHSVRRGDDL